MNIAIRVDASAEIGIGHFIRCMTLANALQLEGHKLKFLYRELPDELIEKLADAGHQAQSIKHIGQTNDVDELAHASWLKTSQSADADAAIAALGDQHYDWLIVDHYGLDHRWETRLLRVVDKIMVIDDLADRKHNCHLLLDQNFTDEVKERYDPLTSKNCTILLGPEYALLMPEYAKLHQQAKPRQEIRSIMISYGGADNFNMTGKTIDALLSLDHTQYTVNITSPLASPFLAEIREKLSDHKNFILHDHLPSLAPLMAKTDLAFGAVGATSWERLCLGVPTIAVTLADNQINIARKLHDEKLIAWLGEAESIGSDDIKNYFVSILKTGNLQQWSENCMAFCDGAGTAKLVDRFSKLRSEQI